MLQNSMKHSDEKSLSLQEQAIEHSKQEKVKIKKPKLSLPKRKVSMNIYTVPYLLFYIYSFITISFGFQYGVTSYILFGIIMIPMIWFVRRMGTNIRNKGYDVILLNSSVLGSTLTNASLPGVFSRYKTFHWIATVLLVVSAGFIKPILMIALFLFLFTSFLSFFKQNTSMMTMTLLVVSLVTLVIAVVEILWMKQLDYLSIVISLVFYMFYEKIKNYEFRTDL